MDEFIDAATEGAVWGVGFGIALVAVRSIRNGVRPAARAVVRGGTAARDTVSGTVRRSRGYLSDIYQEAKSDRSQPTAGGEEPAVSRGRQRPKQPRQEPGTAGGAESSL